MCVKVVPWEIMPLQCETRDLYILLANADYNTGVWKLRPSHSLDQGVLVSSLPHHLPFLDNSQNCLVLILWGRVDPRVVQVRKKKEIPVTAGHLAQTGYWAETRYLVQTGYLAQTEYWVQTVVLLSKSLCHCLFVFDLIQIEIEIFTEGKLSFYLFSPISINTLTGYDGYIYLTHLLLIVVTIDISYTDFPWLVFYGCDE